MYIHLDKLKTANPALYGALAQRGLTDGIREVDPETFPPEVRRELAEWVKVQRNIPMPDVSGRIERLRIETDGLRGIERLREYAAIGLVDNQSNTAKIIDWLEANAESYVSIKTVDQAITALADALEWKKESAPPAAAEVLGTLPNGEPQLPLEGMTEARLRKASLAQVQDWEKRKRVVSPMARAVGSFSARF
jgi:hypothetical protein